MLALLIISTVLSVSFGFKTFGDVRQCVTDSFGTCRTYCQRYHPSYQDFDKVQQCFQMRINEIRSCMQTQRVPITDSTPCYPVSTSQRRANSGITEEIPVAAKCYKRCLRRAHRRCRKDCTGQPIGSEDERRAKLRECKNDDQILDCLEGEVATNNQQTPYPPVTNQQTSNPTSNPTGSPFDPFPTVTYHI